MAETILEVKDLRTYFFNGDSVLRAVDGLSYSVHKGECMAIIGESGSGKSVSALSVLRLVPYPPGLIMDGKILFHGQDLMTLGDGEMQALRGNRISMIFQEPSTALNPLLTIGEQISEVLIPAQEPLQSRRVEGNDFPVALGWDPKPRTTGERVSPPVLRWNAAAGHDCHGHEL